MKANGLSWNSRSKLDAARPHYPLFGKTDFVFPAQKPAIFVDRCFWHCRPEWEDAAFGSEAQARREMG